MPAERPLVAAVIYNRLHARMPLGIDATLRYGLHIPPTKSILQSQLQNPTPYNTRLHQGLPPTPIANPGLASLVAAAHPAKVNYLYYVRKPDHKHDYFTSSASAFYSLRMRSRVRLLRWSTSPCSATPWRTHFRPSCRTPPSQPPASTGTTRPSTSKIRVAAVNELVARGFAGANVTIPHKRLSSPPATRPTATP